MKEPSITANTAFHRMRIPASTAISILEAIRDRYNEKIYEGGGSHKDDQYRYSTFDIAREYGIPRQKTVWAFIDRMANWMPKKYWKKIKYEPEPTWFQSVDKPNRPKYYALWNLLFDGDNPRDTDDILFMLVNKKFPKK